MVVGEVLMRFIPLLLACSMISAVAWAAPTFDTSPYRPIDLDREAKELYGPSATAVSTGPHLWDWRVSVNGQLLNIDGGHVVQSQYGAGWTLVSVGVGKDDWRALNIGTLSNVILPVMQVASDQFFDVDSVTTGLNNFKSVLTTTRNWYKARLRKTFSMVHPIVILTGQTSAGWNQLSASTAVDATRYVLLEQLRAQYDAQLPSVPASVIIATAPYSGSSPDVWLGAADSGNFAIAPPRATSVSCPEKGRQDERCADATYAFGHEMGHAFGLAHSCERLVGRPGRQHPMARCNDSIMQTGKPWSAILLPFEKTALSKSPFLR